MLINDFTVFCDEKRLQCNTSGLSWSGILQNTVFQQKQKNRRQFLKSVLKYKTKSKKILVGFLSWCKYFLGINEICLVLGKYTNPSAETIGRGGCFVLESLVLFYDKLYLKAFNEKKDLFMDSFDTKCQWWMVSCCPRPWLSLFSYLNTCMWVLERIEIFHVYWEEKMFQIWNIWFLVLTSTSKSRLYCVYKGRLTGNCNKGPTLELKYIFSSKGDCRNRSALALIKWSMKSSLKKKCNCTQLMHERQERGASDFTCGCE